MPPLYDKTPFVNIEPCALMTRVLMVQRCATSAETCHPAVIQAAEN